MPIFEYKAVSPTGETVQGTMEAGSMDRVISRLQEAGNIPLQAQEAGKGGFSLAMLRSGRRGIGSRSKITLVSRNREDRPFVILQPG